MQPESKDEAKPAEVLESREALTEYLTALFRDPAMPDLDIPEAPPVTEPLPATESALAVEHSDSQAETAPGGEFDVLIIELGPLSLAVRLVDIDGIIKVPERVRQLPRPKPWLLGMAPGKDVNVQLVETARLVVPEKHHQELAVEAATNGVTDRRVVLIDGGRWGLVCQRAARVLRISEEEVDWRDNRSIRPWLQGTIRDHLCALLDIPEFIDWLDRGAPMENSAS